MRILLVDDDCDFVDVMSYALLRNGHRVLSAHDGEQGLRRALTEGPELVMLDVNLPKLNGFEVCQAVRRASSVPVIMVSGERDEAQVMRGYESGADDYILKPVSPKHLLLRITSLMRRAGTTGTETGQGQRVTLADLTVDPAAFAVRKNGAVVTLTRLEFRILHYLASHADALVPVHQLADYAWESPSGGDAALMKTHVSHIRQKLQRAGGLPVEIRAVPRTGYIFSLGPATDAPPAASLAARHAISHAGSTLG